jgi:hypothetical protein
MSKLFDPLNRRRGRGSALRHEHREQARAETHRVVDTRNMIFGTSAQRIWGPTRHTPGAAGLLLELLTLVLMAARFMVRLPLRARRALRRRRDS